MAGGMNRGVPPETILRHAMREKQQEIEALQSEIERLQSEIAWRDEAIAAFKSWQSKMASYKCDYWLTEGLKLFPPGRGVLQPGAQRPGKTERRIREKKRWNME